MPNHKPRNISNGIEQFHELNTTNVTKGHCALTHQKRVRRVTIITHNHCNALPSQYLYLIRCIIYAIYIYIHILYAIQTFLYPNKGAQHRTTVYSIV